MQNPASAFSLSRLTSQHLTAPRFVLLAISGALILAAALPARALQNELPPSWASTSSTGTPRPKPATVSPQNQTQSQSAAPAQPVASQQATQPAPPQPGLTPMRAHHAANSDIADSPAPWIDVTAPLDPSITPVYEGNAPIQFNFIYDMNRGDPLDLSGYSIGAHSGTHVDAPMHFVRGGAPIDQVPLATLMGPALVINIDPQVIAITADELNRYPWRGAERVLFRTRNSVNAWMVDPHFHRDFTFLAPDAAQLLADNGVKLVGIDYLSIEQFGSSTFRTHIILLSRGIPVVEGLDLRAVHPGEYDFIVLPLKILGHEAAPARAILRPR
jgi:arylformamidase